MKKVKIGFVGCGCISSLYLKNLTQMFKEVEIIGVCDLIRERAEKAVAEWLIVEQDESSVRPTMEAARMSMEYLHSL